MLERPVGSKLDVRRDTVTLYFQDTPSREFYVRGAVAWPEGAYPGFAVLGAQDVIDKTVWVFEDYEFWSIKSVYRDDKKAFRGFTEFLALCWIPYSTNLFFWRQPPEVHQRFLLQCYDDPMVQPKPEFIKVLYSDEAVAINLFREYTATGKVRMSRHSTLYEHLKHEDDGERWKGVHAMRCLLAGFEFVPWVDSGKRDELIEYPL